MEKKGIKDYVFGFKLIYFTIIFLIFSLAVKYFWNEVMPGLFDLKEITYLQAVCLLGLSNFLCGGWNSFIKNSP